MADYQEGNGDGFVKPHKDSPGKVLHHIPVGGNSVFFGVIGVN